jgi:hypothetical protein
MIKQRKKFLLEMDKNITSHPAWRLSHKGYYGKYVAKITLGGLSFYDFGGNVERLTLPNLFDNQYKKVRQLAHALGSFEFRVYTNSEKLINYLIDRPEYQIYIKEICTPKNLEQRQELLKFDENVLYRDSLFYKKYKFRVKPISNYLYRRNKRSMPSNEILQEAADVIHDTFTDSRIVYTNGRFDISYLKNNSWPYHVTAAPNRTVNLPTFYTNDEASIMLYKLRYQSDLLFDIDKVVLLSEI